MSPLAAVLIPLYTSLFSNMSSLIVIGLFGITNGRRVVVHRTSGPKPKSLPYIVYDTAINFSEKDEDDDSDVNKAQVRLIHLFFNIQI